MPRRYTAEEAAGIIVDLPSDQSDLDGDLSDAEPDERLEEVLSNLQSDDNSSDSEEEEYIASDHGSNPNNSDGNVIARDGNTIWKKCSVKKSTGFGRICKENIIKKTPGPTSYSTRRVVHDSPMSAFKILFDEVMLRHVQYCTTTEARRSGNQNWNITLDELEKFLGLLIARGLIGGRNLPIKSFWCKNWGNAFFKNAMSRDRFLEILKFLRFDIKSERRARLINDRFALASSIWNPFIENCQKAYNPHGYLTADEQLLACKARFKYIQYMAK